MTVRLAPLALLVFPSVLAVNDGLNARPWQPPTWNLFDRRSDLPEGRDRPGRLTLIVSQLVGLNVNPERLMFSDTERMSRGMPSRIVGIGSLTALICDVMG